MAIIKKKDVKNFSLLKENKTKMELDELVDADGSPISGDRNAVNDTEIEVPSGQTTDDFVQSSRHGGLNQKGYGGATENPIGGRYESEKKIGELTEDLENSDIDNNQNPDIQDISSKFSKPSTANKTVELINSINKNNLNGQEIGIIINHLLININLESVPQEYKNKLKSLL